MGGGGGRKLSRYWGVGVEVSTTFTYRSAQWMTFEEGDGSKGMQASERG